MAKVVVNSGICGFISTITATPNEDETLDIQFRTTCPNYKSLEGTFLEADPLTACFGKIGTGEIYEMFRPLCPHITCPVPCAALKAIELAGGLALPKDTKITMEP